MEPANLIRYKKDFIITTNTGILNMIFLRTEFRELSSVFMAKLYNQDRNSGKVYYHNFSCPTTTYTTQSIHIDSCLLFSHVLDYALY